MSRREPLLNRAAITAGVALVVSFLALVGVGVSDETRSDLVEVLVVLLPLVSTLVTAWWARRKVTPVADPRDDEGNTLRP